jgi:D-xylose transport system ATP-binding protein
MAGANGDAVLEVVGASKNFGAVTALRDVSLSLGQGEVLALLGDNGAGKSTIIKAISGVHRLDDGEILIDGQAVQIRSSADARARGIETVYQDLAVFDNLTPVANFFAGRERRRPRWLGGLGLLEERTMMREWRELMERLQVRIPDPTKPLGLMSGGQRQAVAVAKAVAFAGKIVILDEPTAALGVRESGRVLELIQRLPSQGISVILVSHNMQEVMRVADRAVVLRQGEKVGETVPTPENQHALVSMIVGAAPEPAAQAGKSGGTAVSADALSAVRRAAQGPPKG